MNPFIIKQNDTLPALIVRIKTREVLLGGVISFDLDGVTGITFSMIDNCGNLKISEQSGTILCSSGGTIQYSWQNGDTDEAGKFTGEFELNYSNGGKLSVPQLGGIDIEIIKDINPY